jgi:hypothetical protein
VQVEKYIIDLNMNSKLVKIVCRRRLPAKNLQKPYYFPSNVYIMKKNVIAFSLLFGFLTHYIT